MTRIAENVNPIFQKFGFTFLDTTDVSSRGVSDDEFIDGDHGSEKTMIRLTIEMAEADPAARRYVADVESLKARLQSTTSPYEVFRDYAHR